jgi:hypothetical protein
MDDFDLSHLLDGEPGSDPTPDALEAVMRRHRRAGVRTLVGALGIALVAGPLGGFVLARATDSGGNGGSNTVSAAAAATGTAGATAQASLAGLAEAANTGLADLSADVGMKLAGGGKLTHVFNRTADGVAIRAYEREITLPTPPAGAPAIPPACKPTGGLVGELSTPEAVGQGVSVTFPPDGALIGVRIGIFGIAEGAPVAWAIAKVDGTVEKVRLRLPDGSTDEMSPDHGWVVLAHHVAAAAGTEPKKAIEGTVVEALDGGGKVIASHSTSDPKPEPAAECKGALRGNFRPDRPEGPKPPRPQRPKPSPTTTIAKP